MSTFYVVELEAGDWRDAVYDLVGPFETGELALAYGKECIAGAPFVVINMAEAHLPVGDDT